ASRFYIRDDGQNRARTTLVLAVDPIPLQILLGTFIWDPIEKIWPLGLAVGPENRPTQLVSPGFTLVQANAEEKTAVPRSPRDGSAAQPIASQSAVPSAGECPSYGHRRHRASCGQATALKRFAPGGRAHNQGPLPRSSRAPLNLDSTAQTYV
ncbi:hypothetical protein THAOC_30870, partial [Thalassiosira oceanica]